MNLHRAEGVALARDLAAFMQENRGVEMVVCPPATLLAPVAACLSGSAIALGGQDCHAAAKGAHTGDISADMLRDAGCSHVILGHSERRMGYGEGNDAIRAKAEAAHAAGLVAIICVGETAWERDAGQAAGVVESQIRGSVPAGATAGNTVIAYEPVWAIGTGITASLADIAAVLGAIRKYLRDMLAQGNIVRILYGGSVKPDNAAEILGLNHVDGALVGGASLKAADFLAIADPAT